MRKDISYALIKNWIELNGLHLTSGETYLQQPLSSLHYTLVEQCATSIARCREYRRRATVPTGQRGSCHGWRWVRNWGITYTHSYRSSRNATFVTSTEYGTSHIFEVIPHTVMIFNYAQNKNTKVVDAGGRGAGKPFSINKINTLTNIYRKAVFRMGHNELSFPLYLHIDNTELV